MSSNDPVAQLIVEGKNDQHVIWALCEKHNIPETFSVETPTKDYGGIDKLLSGLSVRLKTPRLSTLGIVLDSDQNLEGRWQSIKARLADEGYETIPERPYPKGTIITHPAKPKLGIWVMPNNQLPGMLENFVAYLIPEGDELAAKVEAILTEIERLDLNKYQRVKRPKAFIHTWLAWQENPGQPMGQAITAHALNYNAPLATMFVEWLSHLFEQEHG